jgi:hypothetical protein
MDTSLENFDEYVYKYFKKWFNIQFYNKNFLEKIIKIFHLLIIIFIIIGIFLPSKLLIYYLIFILIIFISWIFLDKCLLTLLFEKDKEFFPLSYNFRNGFILLVIFISLVGYFYPKYSLCNVTFTIFKYLEKYNY